MLGWITWLLDILLDFNYYSKTRKRVGKRSGNSVPPALLGFCPALNLCQRGKFERYIGFYGAE